MSSRTSEAIEIFSLGMSSDLRKIIRVNRKIMRPFATISHFDVYPDRLVPKRDWTTDSDGTTKQITRFTYADSPVGGYTTWGLGVSTTSPALYYEANNIDPITGGWSTPSNNVCANSVGSQTNPWLFAYKGSLYFMSNGHISQYVIASGTMNSNWQTMSYTNTAKPFVHPRTGAAYFFFDNNVYQLDPNGTWHSSAVQTLPSNMYITSAAQYGNNLAIGAAALDGFSNSTVYLWDLSVTAAPSSTNFTESIDWGRGKVMHLGYLLGSLVGISNEYVDNSFGANKGRLVSRVYSGVVAQESNYITVDNVTATPISASSFYDTDKLYFPAAATLLGDQRPGVWSIDKNGLFTIEATEPGTTGATRINSVYRIGRIWYISRSDGTSLHTNNSDNYTAPAVMETVYYGDRFNHSEFFGATVSFEPLTSGQSVTLKYRPSSTTSWTTLGTQSTVGKKQLQVVGTSTHANMQLDEYQFRVESTGATITGLFWQTDSNDQNIYG